MAQTGSVAAAVRWIARAVLGGGSDKFIRTSDVDTIRGNLASDRGIGWEVVERFLNDIPGINGPGRFAFLVGLPVAAGRRRRELPTGRTQ